jgi:hypothetical protein
MTLTNTYLTQAASAMAGETYVYPNYLLVSTDSTVTAIGTQDTSLSGEIGDRIETTNLRTGRTIRYNAIRSPADVVDGNNGDSLYAAGLSSASAATDFHMGMPLGLLTHTTNFSIEFNFGVLTDR